MQQVRLIPFPMHDTGNGSLMMFQCKPKAVPFSLKKVLVVDGMKKTDVRGKHAHKKTNEIVIPLSGGCDVEVTDGVRSKEYYLSANGEGIYLPAKLWRVLKNFQKGTVLLIIADTLYNEKDYIRSYDQFLKLNGVKKQR
jgi:dTDP-4-dehydrorhamnose 3,5-epimerase-like enzyme